MADTQPLDQTALPGSRPPSVLKQSEVLAGRYELIRFIANGGMGEVWEAEDRALHERVALKTIRQDALNDDTLERFRREVKLARKVSHRNVCRVFEFGEHKAAEGRSISFLTMELLVGTPLDAVLRQRGKLPPDEALGLLEQMAAALDAAHAEGIVHRDFKTPNVFVVPTTTGSRAVVTDFGIARALTDDARLTVDPTQMIGTPAYMAPEQVEGSSVGPAADLYALGVVAYELVSGQLPFHAPSAMAMALMRLREPARRLADIEPHLDPKWDAAVARALSRKPEERFATASAFVGALRGTASPIAPLPSTPAAAPRGRRPALALAGLVLVAGLAALSWRASHRSDPATPALTRGGVLRVSVAISGGGVEPNGPGFTTSGLASAHIYEFLSKPGLLTTSVRGDDVILRLARPRLFHPHPCWPGGQRRPVTADDIAFSLRAAAAPAGWAQIPELAVEGDTVVLPGIAHREAELGIWLDALELQPAMPADCAADAQTFPSGTGPFRLERTGAPDQLELVPDDANRVAGDRGPPYVDRIIISQAPSALSVVPLLKAGTLDVVEVPKNEWADFFVDGQDRQVKLRPPFDALPVKIAGVKVPGTIITYLGLTARQGGPLRDPQLRRAIAIGINRAALTNLGGHKVSALDRLLPSNIPGAAPVLSESLQYQPEESRRLIAASTPASSQPLFLGCFHRQRDLADELARQLGEVGLKVNVVELSGDPDLTAIDFFINVEAMKPDPLQVLLFASKPEIAPKTQALLKRLLGMPYAARLKEYAEFERVLLSELPVIPLTANDSNQPGGFYLYRDEVHGFADEDTHLVLEILRPFVGVHLEPAGR